MPFIKYMYGSCVRVLQKLRAEKLRLNGILKALTNKRRHKPYECAAMDSPARNELAAA